MELRTEVVRSDRIHIEDCGTVLIVTASGPFGLDECLRAMTRVRQAMADSPARAILVDLRGAALTIATSEYFELVRAALDRPIRHPIAFVVGPWLMLIADAHRLLMGRRGLCRRFFPSLGPALRFLGSLRRCEPEPRRPDLLG